MAIYKNPAPTKDGRYWYFKIGFQDALWNNKQYKSKKYATKKEVIEAERKYAVTATNKFETSEMTFEDLYNEFIKHRDDKVKETTKYGYSKKKSYIESLFKIKVKDFNIIQYELWKQQINNTNLGTTYKNDIYKFLKSIMNYGALWHNFNFTGVYNKMTNFKNPNEPRREMSYYTYDEFKQYISCEDDLRCKCVFEIFYYCGLRKGELKGLIWKDIYFDKKVLSVNKQIIQLYGRKNYHLSDTKTRDSKRIVPIAKVLLNDLKELYEHNKKTMHGFNDDFFVACDARPIFDSSIYDRRTYLANKANLKRIRIHDFRHSCASPLINNGTNVTLVAKYLGYTKSVETLNTYPHMFSTALDNVVSLIDSLDDN